MDEREFDGIITRYTPLVRTVAAGIIGRRKQRDIEEVVSDVFVAYWKADKYDESDGGTKNLLVTIARRQAINRAKQLGRRIEEELDEETAAAGLVDEEVADRLESGVIREVINGLTPPDNEIFTRRYFYCQSVKEIAASMKLKPKYVENRLYLAKKTIREQLSARGIKGEGRERD